MKRGKQPARHEPTLQLVHDPATPPPATGDVTAGITDWGMLGNDTYGDCGPAATEHVRMCKGLLEPSVATVLHLYFQYGAAMGEGDHADEGVEIASWLNWLYKQGIIDAYAEIPTGSADAIHEAMLHFDGVIVGVSLTDDAEQLFTSGQPWTIADGETPDANDGHAIALVAYDETSDTFVTWGATQKATVAWDSACIDEAWVIVTPEDANRAGVDFNALVAAIEALGGTGPGEPSPTPAPPTQTTPSLWRRIVAYLRALLGRLENL